MIPALACLALPLLPCYTHLLAHCYPPSDPPPPPYPTLPSLHGLRFKWRCCCRGGWLLTVYRMTELFLAAPAQVLWLVEPQFIQQYSVWRLDTPPHPWGKPFPPPPAPPPRTGRPTTRPACSSTTGGTGGGTDLHTCPPHCLPLPHTHYLIVAERRKSRGILGVRCAPPAPPPPTPLPHTPPAARPRPLHATPPHHHGYAFYPTARPRPDCRVRWVVDHTRAVDYRYCPVDGRWWCNWMIYRTQPICFTFYHTPAGWCWIVRLLNRLVVRTYGYPAHWTFGSYCCTHTPAALYPTYLYMPRARVCTAPGGVWRTCCSYPILATWLRAHKHHTAGLLTD